MKEAEQVAYDDGYPLHGTLVEMSPFQRARREPWYCQRPRVQQADQLRPRLE